MAGLLCIRNRGGLAYCLSLAQNPITTLILLLFYPCISLELLRLERISGGSTLLDRDVIQLSRKAIAIPPGFFGAHLDLLFFYFLVGVVFHEEVALELAVAEEVDGAVVGDAVAILHNLRPHLLKHLHLRSNRDTITS